MAALQATHADQVIKDTVSESYIAQEIDATTDGLAVAIPENEWSVFATVSMSQVAVILDNIAAYID